jgi:hypothetical protein
LDLLEIYILNLIVTVGMFIVMMVRAWIEVRQYRLMWTQLEWIKTKETAGRILKAERSLFMRIEGGEELYDMLCGLFGVEAQGHEAGQDKP